MNRFSPETRTLVNNALAAMEREAVYNDKIQFLNNHTAGNYFALRLADEEREIFSVAFLNSQHRLIACEDLFKGTINQAPVFPREIAKRALALNAAAVVLAHNHPSGESEPSSADRAITEMISDAMGLLDIRLLDHFVVTVNRCYSFADHGLI